MESIDWGFWIPRLMWFAFGGGVGFVFGIILADVISEAPDLPWHD